MYDPSEMLEDFISSIDNLPSEIQFIFNEIMEKDLDFKNNATRRRDLLVELKNLSSSNDDQTQDEKIKNVLQEYQGAKVLSNEKVKLAERALDLLEKQIKRLSADIISKIEAQEGISLNKSLNPILKISGSSISLKEDASRHDQKKTTFTASALKRMKKKNENHAARTNEVFCFCRQVSYGEMIGCDNENCQNEWFHLGCVGLTEPPRGVWFCPDCISSKRNDLSD